MKKIIMHIDVNNAFLSWEAVYLLRNNLYNTDIRNIVSVISKSTNKRNGIVIAKSNPAKKLGIYTSEVIYNSYKKAPNLMIFEPHYEVYEEESKKLFTILKRLFEEIEIASIDECYIDYTSYIKKYGNEVEFAQKLKEYVYQKLGWTINIGIANTKICAKMASDLIKPNKVNTIYENQVKDIMWPLPIEKLYMVGKKSVEKLKLFKINTIGDLAQCNVETLIKLFKNNAYLFHNYSNVIYFSIVKEHEKNKDGISISTTLENMITTKKELVIITNNLADKLTKKLKDKELLISTIGVSIKNIDFKIKNKQITITDYTNDISIIKNNIYKLIDEIYIDETIRMVAIRFNNFRKRQLEQLSLFNEKNIKKNHNEKLESTIKNIKNKYGNDIIN